MSWAFWACMAVIAVGCVVAIVLWFYIQGID